MKQKQKAWLLTRPLAARGRPDLLVSAANRRCETRGLT